VENSRRNLEIIYEYKHTYSMLGHQLFKLANRIDVIYGGPGPAVNGYVASQGKDPRIISGAARWCRLCSEK
jgi:hypothetical protein